MIIASATGENGRRVLVLGVTRENLERLTAGRPIHLRAESHPGIPEDLAIAIVYGETGADIVKQLRPMIGDDTRTVVVPRGEGETH